MRLRILITWLMMLVASVLHAGEATSDGFALPQEGHVFSFPHDYGAHNDFKLEWWYITGHLFGDDGRRFGFEATFFRSAGSPTNTNGGDTTAFGTSQLYMTHVALLDVKTGTFLHQERLNRDGWDAYAATNGLDTRDGNWFLRMTSTNPATMELRGSVQGESAFHLNLTASQPLVVFGQNSVSRKAADPAAASYYLTFPRLQATGEVKFNGETNAVKGEAWMDHEISSSQLGSDEVGWDWCCLQFKDGGSIMAYRMRHKDGSQDAYSTLTWVDANGRLTQLPSAEFTMIPVHTWKSPTTGATYPVSMKLQTHESGSNKPITFTLEPLADNQELSGSSHAAYWEGACRIRDEAGNEVGSAYLELTGYTGSLGDSLR